MGLDSYAYSVAKNAEINQQFVKSFIDLNIDRTELAYWRKFNALHGWMQDRAIERGFDEGEKEFNCVYFKLDEGLLDDLSRAIEEKTLEPREGFFWGVQEINEYQLEATRKFIADAKESMLDGRDVYYYSWW